MYFFESCDPPHLIFTSNFRTRCMHENFQLILNYTRENIRHTAAHTASTIIYNINFSIFFTDHSSEQLVIESGET